MSFSRPDDPDPGLDNQDVPPVSRFVLSVTFPQPPNIPADPKSISRLQGKLYASGHDVAADAEQRNEASLITVLPNKDSLTYEMHFTTRQNVDEMRTKYMERMQKAVDPYRATVAPVA